MLSYPTVVYTSRWATANVVCDNMFSVAISRQTLFSLMGTPQWTILFCVGRRRGRGREGGWGGVGCQTWSITIFSRTNYFFKCNTSSASKPLHPPEYQMLVSWWGAGIYTYSPRGWQTWRWDATASISLSSDGQIGIWRLVLRDQISQVPYG